MSHALTLSTYPEHAGKQTTHDWRIVVTRVPFSEPADITFQKYTRDFSTTNARPFKVGKSGYTTLAAAVRAIAKARHWG